MHLTALTRECGSFLRQDVNQVVFGLALLGEVDVLVELALVVEGDHAYLFHLDLDYPTVEHVDILIAERDSVVPTTPW